MYSHQVSYHEAGHAFAYWYIGVDLHSVQVIAQKAIGGRAPLVSKNGTLLTGASGICEPRVNLFAARNLNTENRQAILKEICCKQIFVSLSGPINTEFDTKLPLAQCFASSCSHDASKIQMCCEIGRITQLHYAKLLARTRRLLDTDHAKSAMKTIARRLAANGYLRGHRVATCCDSVFGHRPRPFDFSN
jgi:hypothetical protein